MEPELRETLVAYLDGGLDAEAERRVEQLLNADERVRAELQRLQSTWDLLDRLPRADVGATFTRSTVEMVALSVEQELRPAGSGVRLRLPAVAGGLAAACLLGFIAARLAPDRNQQLLRDLPILEHLGAYRQAPDIGFLRQLERAEVFAEETSPPTLEVPHAQRLSGVKALPAEQKEELLRKFERFQKLPSAEQRRLRQLDTAIARDRQAASLYAVAARFQHWLDQLSGVERAELMALPAEGRLARIKQWRADEERRLSHEDQSVFAEWVEQKLLERMRPAGREEFRKQLAKLPEGRRRQVVGQRLQAWQAGRPNRRSDTSPDSKPRPRPFWNAAARQELSQRLSPRGQRQLEDAGPDAAQRKLIQSWVREVFFSPVGARGLKLPAPDVDDERLKKFFEQELDAAERVHLLSLPADQMRRQLQRQYHRAHPAHEGREKP